MKKEYIVGIDFGNGETSAYFTPIDNNAPDIIDENSVRLRNANDPGERKIRTAINLTKEGEFSTTKPGAVQIGLKAKIATLDEHKKQAYKAFIKDIYNRIRMYNPHLIENGESNFYICIASPTKWNEKDKQDYIEFFNDALADFNQEILWVINESDAAYFTHRNDNQNVLVIDFGSSTIDYTLVSHGLKIGDDDWSNDYLGARAIERAMLASYINDPNSNFNQKLNANIQALNEIGNGFYDVLTQLEYNFRKVKEEGFSNYNPQNANRPFDYNIEYDFYFDTGAAIFNNDEYKFEHRGFFRNHNNKMGVCEEYIEKVREDFTNLNNMITGNGITIDKIIMSGGACIMKWVEEEIRNVFGENVNIVLDPDPEYVVSKGIARYAKAQKNALDELLKRIEAIPYQDIYMKEYTAVRKTSTIEIVKKEADIQIKNLNNPDGNEILEKYMEIIQNIDGGNVTFYNLVKTAIESAINKEVQERVKSVILDIFNYAIDNTDIKIGIEPSVGRFTDDCFKPGGVFNKIVYDGIDLTKFFFTWNKKRNKTEVEEIINSVNSKLESEINNNLTLIAENLEERANEIKEQVLPLVEGIFYSKQLFNTTFKN